MPVLLEGLYPGSTNKEKEPKTVTLGFKCIPPLSLFVVMLSKVHLTSHSRMSGSRSVITLS